MPTYLPIQDGCKFLAYGGTRYVLHTPDDRHFLVSSTTKEILEALREGEPLENICASLSGPHDGEVSADELRQVLERRYAHLGIFPTVADPVTAARAGTPANWAFLRCWDLVPDRWVLAAAERLSWMYRAIPGLLILAMIIAAHGLIYSKGLAAFHPQPPSWKSAADPLSRLIQHSGPRDRSCHRPVPFRGQAGEDRIRIVPVDADLLRGRFAGLATAAPCAVCGRSGRGLFSAGRLHRLRSMRDLVAELRVCGGVFGNRRHDAAGLEPGIPVRRILAAGGLAGASQTAPGCPAAAEDVGETVDPASAADSRFRERSIPELTGVQKAAFVIYALFCNLFLAFAILLSIRYLRSSVFGLFQYVQLQVSQIIFSASTGDWATLIDQAVTLS